MAPLHSTPSRAEPSRALPCRAELREQEARGADQRGDPIPCIPQGGGDEIEGHRSVPPLPPAGQGGAQLLAGPRRLRQSPMIGLEMGALKGRPPSPNRTALSDGSTRRKTFSRLGANFAVSSRILAAASGVNVPQDPVSQPCRAKPSRAESLHQGVPDSPAPALQIRARPQRDSFQARAPHSR